MKNREIIRTFLSFLTTTQFSTFILKNFIQQLKQENMILQIYINKYINFFSNTLTQIQGTMNNKISTSLLSGQKDQYHTHDSHNNNKKLLIQINKAQYYYKNNKMQSVIKCLQHYSHILHFYNKAKYILSVAYLSTNKSEKAIVHFNELIKVNPHFKTNLYLLLSIAYKKNFQFVQSLQCINYHIKFYPSIDGFYYRCKLYIKIDKYQQALTDVSYILKQQINHLPSILLKLKILRKTKKYLECLEYINNNIQTSVNIQECQVMQIQKIQLLIQMNDTSLAIQCIQELEKKNYQNISELYYLKGKAYCKIDHQDAEAMLCWNQSIDFNTDTNSVTNSLFCVSIKYMHDRDFYSALECLKRSQYLKVNINLLINLIYLAEAVTFLMKRKFSEAVELMNCIKYKQFQRYYQQAAFLLNLYYKCLGFGLFSIGKHSEALKIYKQITLIEKQTQDKITLYNMRLCEGILASNLQEPQRAVQYFEQSLNYLNHPEPYFYISVILAQNRIKQCITYDLMIQIINILDVGLKVGDNYHMWYYHALINIHLGQNSEALEDINHAIQKSQDNCSKYFFIRAMIFKNDHNYEQAIIQYDTCLSIDQNMQDALLEKAKCYLILSKFQNAYEQLYNHPQYLEYKPYFLYYEQKFIQIIQSKDIQPHLLEKSNFALGKFDDAGPSGKLIIAIIYGNYHEIIQLMQYALQLNICIGSLQTQDLSILKAYCEYSLEMYNQCLETLCELVNAFELLHDKQINISSEEDQKKQLTIKVNIILIYFKMGKIEQSIRLIQELLNNIHQGEVYCQLKKLSQFLKMQENINNENILHIDLFRNESMLSDFIPIQNHHNLMYKYLIRYPKIKLNEIQGYNYDKLLIDFNLDCIENKPQAPWIRRGQHGVIFTNLISNFDHLKLNTEENQPKIDKIKQDLQLNSSVLQKLDKLTNNNNKNKNHK